MTVAHDAVASYLPSRGAHARTPLGLRALCYRDAPFLRRLCRIPWIHTDEATPCPVGCGGCPACYRALRAIVEVLALPDTRAWVVLEGAAPVGLAYFTDLVPEREAQMHLAFPDGRLLSRTPALLESMVRLGVRRVYAAVPGFARALVAYGTQRLRMTVQGTVPECVEWRSRMWPVTLLERRF